MNARIDMYSPEEVAKSVGVTSVTICNWCRSGFINCNQVGNGDKANRYEIEEDEYRYLRDLARRYGPKKVLLYYKKDWKENGTKGPGGIEYTDISADCKYSAATAASFLGVDKSSINRNCRTGRIHCESKPCSGTNGAKGYNEYLIPGWEVLYLKSLYEKYGKKPGQGGAMRHYIYDVDKRGNENMDWKLDMDQVEDDNNLGVSGIKVEYDEEKEVINLVRENPGAVDIVNAGGVSGQKYAETRYGNSRKEPTDDKLLDDFIKIRELKKDIDNAEAKLNQMKAEYEQLKGELIEWL